MQAGLTPEEALAAATSLPAQAFGLTDRGRIAPGLRADLLLVKGDPTKAIMDTRAIVSVWKMGVEDDRASYRAAIESQKAAPPLDPSNPANPVSAQNASSPSQAQQPGMNPRDRKLSLTEIRSLIVGKTVKWDDGGQSVYETVGTFRYTKMGRSSEGDYQITDGAVCVKFMNGGVLRCDAWYRDGQSYYIKTRNDSRFNVLSID